MIINLKFDDFPSLQEDLSGSTPGATISGKVMLTVNSVENDSATLSIDGLEISKTSELAAEDTAAATAEEDPKSAVSLIYGSKKGKK